MSERHRQSVAYVDLGAIGRNVEALRRHAGPVRFCAVVKADAYGHGAVPVARAAIDAGADYLAVALVEEGVELREAGLEAPVLLLSEPPAGSEAVVAAYGLEPTVYSSESLDALSVAAEAANTVISVHLKVNTGMNRVGALPEDAVKLARQIVDSPSLDLAGVCTHMAVADNPSHPANSLQHERFTAAVDALEEDGVPLGIRHAANTAATLADPAAYGWDMVRCGIGIYGISPSSQLTDVVLLEPALSLESELTNVMFLPEGEGVSYGHRYHLRRASWIGTVPLGYADGVRRGLSGRMGVLIRGRRRPIAGTVTMDQILVDLGQEEHSRGERVVLIGRQGDETITAEDWAEVLDTIGYEVACGIGARVPRVHVKDRQQAG